MSGASELRLKRPALWQELVDQAIDEARLREAISEPARRQAIAEIDPAAPGGRPLTTAFSAIASACW